MNHVFKCVNTVDGEAIFFAAGDLREAKQKFADALGDVPEELLVWTEIDALPEGAVFFGA